jgi:hypothetical protein
MSKPVNRATFVVSALADVWTLVLLAPDWSALAVAVQAPRQFIATRGPNQACVVLMSAALWLASVWMAVGLAVVVMEHLPGRVGRTAEVFAAALLPSMLRHVLVGTAGVTLALSPAAASAANSQSPSAPPSATTSSATAVVTAPTPVSRGPISWPSDPAPEPSPTDYSGAISPPSLSWPTDSPEPTHPGFATPRSATGNTSQRGPAMSTAPPGTASPPNNRTADPDVTVRAGDSLWLIAAHRLRANASAAEIAANWPRWYAANRTVIGDDPGQLMVGQRLRSPKD